MKRIFYTIIGSIMMLGVLSVPTSAISLAPCPEDEYQAECEKERAELLRRQEAGEPIPRSVETRDDSDHPTFVAESDEAQQSARLWFGKNLLLAGNNLTTAPNAENGLLLAAANNLNLDNESEYGFIFGNIVKFTGATQRDLYVSGNSITLDADANIGRDVFAAGNKFYIETDLTGDLSVTASHVIIKEGVTIDGNVNIIADRIEIGNGVEIGGKLVYNDNANINELQDVTYGGLEVYHVAEASVETKILAAIYSKLLSIASLFLAMALIIAFYPRLHEKVRQEDSASRSGMNLALGCGALIVVPIFVALAFLTIIAAPLGIMALLAYFIAIYLAQGFTGIWLGHLIIEKFFKLKGNAFIEVLIGLVILSALALIPFIGVATGILSMMLGVGLIISCIKGNKIEDSVKTTKVAKKTSKGSRKK